MVAEIDTLGHLIASLEGDADLAGDMHDPDQISPNLPGHFTSAMVISFAFARIGIATASTNVNCLYGGPDFSTTPTMPGAS